MIRVACSRRQVLSLQCRCALVGLVGAGALCLAANAEADGIGAFVDLGYAVSETTNTDPTGVSSKSKSDSFSQRYNISLDRKLYPSLALSAGGVINNIVSHNEVASTTSSSTATSLSPFATISLTNSFLPTTLSYNRRESKVESNGVAFPTQILESYTVRSSLKPEGFPALNVSYGRTHIFDEQRIQQDITTNSFQWGTGYSPTTKINLGYEGGFSTSSNAISHLDSESLSNTARIGYGDQFFKNRVSFATNYNLATSTTRTTSSGQGFVFIQQAPLNGTLSAVTSPTSIPLITVTSGQLTSTPALNVGTANFNLVTASPPPVVTQLNVGFDFGFGTTVSVNTIYLSVVSGTNPRPVALEQIPNITQLFAWTVYTSDDGVNWTLSTVPVTPQFGPDPSGGSDSVGFILNLASPLAGRFLKAVVTPVPVTTLEQTPSISAIFQNGSNQLDINSIAVTRLQAFSRQDAKSFAGGGIDSVAGQLGMNVTAQLLDNPLLTYDAGFGLSHSSGSLQPLEISWFLSNGLSLDHRFNEVFSGNARVSVQQQKGSQTSLTSNVGYSAGLSIVPLPTLSHSITFSGSVTQLGDPNSTTSNAFFVSNTAQLYKGVALSASAGYSTSTSPGGRKNDSVVFGAGLSLVPRKDLSVSLGYNDSSAKQTGGAQGDMSTFNRSASATVAYTPTEALYFTGSWVVSAQNDQPTFITQNYAVSWAPFRGGTLQFNISYTETLSSLDNSKTRTVAPTVRWNIRPGMTLDLSYQYLSISSPTAGTTEGSTLNSALRFAI